MKSSNPLTPVILGFLLLIALIAAMLASRRRLGATPSSSAKHSHGQTSRASRRVRV